MKKVLFFLSYFLVPAFPLFFYLNGVGGSFDSYAVSVSLGIIAFVLMCGQFILASRPAFAVKALGIKGLLSFHATMPVVIVVLAGAHKILKESYGFSDDTFQASLGGIAWWAFVAVIVLAVLFMANTFWLKLNIVKKLKAWVYKTFGLTYKTTRLLHNVTVAVSLLLMGHVFLASSSDFGSNPVGILFMGGWLAFSLSLYARYKTKNPKAQTVQA